MPRIYLPSLGAAEWRRLLADPARHWKPGNSAFELAVAWGSAQNKPRGLPGEVAATLDTNAALWGAELLLDVPEHRVRFEGGGHPSQNDLWALLRTADGTASSWHDFQAYARLLGAEVVEGSLSVARTPTEIPLFVGWVTSQPASDAELAAG